MRLVSGILAAVIPIFFSLILLPKLRAHRVDLEKGASGFDGASRAWQINVMRPSNYTPEGRRLLVWYYVAVIAQAAAVLFVLLLLYRA
jgi:hypothetical protein